VKNTVIAYFAVLALTGLVTLSVQGAALLQKSDPRGALLLIIVVGGLLSTFLYGVITSRTARVKVQPPKAATMPGVRTTTSTSTADYDFSPAAVWSIIRPAEAAIVGGSNVAYAFTVPAIPDGPRERQCFFGRNGSISILEIVEEVPERLAVTQSIFPPDENGASTKTVYRLEPTTKGCSLTLESIVETPDFLMVDQKAMQRFGDSYLEGLRVLLEQRKPEGTLE
jgi:hypothetical protein